MVWQTLDRPPARLDLVDLRGALTDGGRPLEALTGDKTIQASRPLVGGEPGAKPPAAYQDALASLLGERSGAEEAAQPAAEGATQEHGGDRVTYQWLGVLNRIERAWHDSCAIPPYLTKLATQLLAGACERGNAFSAREWWLLQLAERANHGPDKTAFSTLGPQGDMAPAAGPTGSRRTIPVVWSARL